MLKYLCSAAMALAMASPAMAQKPADRPATAVKGPDVAIVKEAVDTLKEAGECTVEFTVGLDGKAKDLKPTCTPEAYAPYVVRAMAAAEYLPEIYAGEMFETEGLKQPFTFGKGKTVSSAPGDVAPVQTKGVEPKDVGRAIKRVRQSGGCNVVFTVGADGKPKDIKPGCTPAEYDPLITNIVADMRYKPGEKAGAAIDWPNFAMTLPLVTKPE